MPNEKLCADHVLKAIEHVKSQYPESVWPEPEANKASSVDCYTAAGCRLACDNIKRILLNPRDWEPQERKATNAE